MTKIGLEPGDLVRRRSARYNYDPQLVGIVVGVTSKFTYVIYNDRAKVYPQDPDWLDRI